MSFCDRYAIDVSSVQDKVETKTKPPGFVRQRASTASTSGRAGKAAQQQEESKELFDRRTAALQNLAYSPIKQVLMTSFMMYMAGSNLHFFSILTVINGMYSPVNAILKSGVLSDQSRAQK
eukprot:jgi/Picre1/30837/NNA_006197.t1